jgi:hypothetical protein
MRTQAQQNQCFVDLKYLFHIFFREICQSHKILFASINALFQIVIGIIYIGLFTL